MFAASINSSRGRTTSERAGLGRRGTIDVAMRMGRGLSNNAVEIEDARPWTECRIRGGSLSSGLLRPSTEVEYDPRLLKNIQRDHVIVKRKRILCQIGSFTIAVAAIKTEVSQCPRLQLQTFVGVSRRWFHKLKG